MSDINGLVTGLQGFPVSSATPQDGYVLVWDATDGYWKPQAFSRPTMQSDYFTSSGTWTCPVGVTSVLLMGCGGGGGGGSGATNGHPGIAGGGGGGGAIQQTTYLTVIPGVTYTITIGNGGSGAIGVTSGYGNYGNDGNSTIFANMSGTLFSAIGANGGSNGNTNSNVPALAQGGNNWAGFYSFARNPSSFYYPTAAASGGSGNGTVSGAGGNGAPNYLNVYSGGVGGNIVSGNEGGGGGGAGPQGNGGTGGDGTSSGAGNNGSNGTANTGSGGGGSGMGATGSGNGGDGGSGYLYIVYIA